MTSKKKILKAIIFLDLLVATCLLAVPVVSGCFPDFFVVQSGSMEPLIHKGDMVFIKKGGTEPATYLNHIIAFYNPIEGQLIFHRVVGLEGAYLITKGDANTLPDFYNPSLKETLGTYWFGVRFLPLKILD